MLSSALMRNTYIKQAYNITGLYKLTASHLLNDWITKIRAEDIY